MADPRTELEPGAPEKRISLYEQCIMPELPDPRWTCVIGASATGAAGIGLALTIGWAEQSADPSVPEARSHLEDTSQIRDQQLESLDTAVTSSDQPACTRLILQYLPADELGVERYSSAGADNLAPADTEGAIADILTDEDTVCGTDRTEIRGDFNDLERLVSQALQSKETADSAQTALAVAEADVDHNEVTTAMQLGAPWIGLAVVAAGLMSFSHRRYENRRKVLEELRFKDYDSTRRIINSAPKSIKRKMLKVD